MNADEVRVYERGARAGPKRTGCAGTTTSVPGRRLEGRGPGIALEAPTARDGGNALLHARRSSRNLWHPLHLGVLSEVLHCALAPRRDGGRPYPTSGGCDELRFLLLCQRVVPMPPGWYWLTPDVSRLVPADLRGGQDVLAKVSTFLGLDPERAPSVVMLAFCDWETLSSRYEHCTLLSGLWDWGAALQTLYLSACATGTPACAVAALMPRTLALHLGVDCRAFGHVGTFALGGPPPVGRDASA
ncbi:MAG: hypothetical protein ACRDZ7_22805 [Acidimicrobiia bacterium]